MDYKALLTKYIAHIVSVEGDDHLDEIWMDKSTWTLAEFNALTSLSDLKFTNAT